MAAGDIDGPRFDFDNLRRVAEQRSGAEVPGFHARTVIDDTIGKLFAVRQRMRSDVDGELAGVLDDVEALAEKLIDLAYDPDAPDIDDGASFPAPELMNYTNHLVASASGSIYFCSCGAPCMGALPDG